MKDVFRHPEKEPQPQGADQEPNGEMETQVFAGREPRGEEGPDAWEAELQAPHDRCVDNAAPESHYSGCASGLPSGPTWTSDRLVPARTCASYATMAPRLV